MPQKIVTCFPLRFEDKSELLDDYRREMVRELTESKAGRRMLRTYTVLFLSEYLELDERQRSVLINRIRSDTAQTNVFNGVLSEMFADLPKKDAEPAFSIDFDIPEDDDTENDDDDNYEDDDYDYEDNDDDDYEDNDDDDYEDNDDYDIFEDDDDIGIDVDDIDENKSHGLLSRLRDWFYPEE